MFTESIMNVFTCVYIYIYVKEYCLCSFFFYYFVAKFNICKLNKKSFMFFFIHVLNINNLTNSDDS